MRRFGSVPGGGRVAAAGGFFWLHPRNRDRHVGPGNHAIGRPETENSRLSTDRGRRRTLGTGMGRYRPGYLAVPPSHPEPAAVETLHNLVISEFSPGPRMQRGDSLDSGFRSVRRPDSRRPLGARALGGARANRRLQGAPVAYRRPKKTKPRPAHAEPTRAVPGGGGTGGWGNPPGTCSTFDLPPGSAPWADFFRGSVCGPSPVGRLSRLRLAAPPG
jgi:hypothetical protein